MMSPSEKRRSSRPYETDPDDAADGDRGRQESEPHGAHAEPLAGVEHEHGPGGPERDVEREDRQGERAHRRMREQPADPLGHLGPQARPLAQLGLVLVTTRETRSAPSTKHTAFVANGSAMPDGEQEGADRRGDQLVRQQEGALHPGVGEAEVLARHEARQERAARRVGERLRGAEDEQRDEHDGDADRPADDRRDEDDQREPRDRG